MAISEEAFDERLGQLSVLTTDSGLDADLIDPSVRDVLSLAREHLGMDVAFVFKFVSGQRVFVAVDPNDGNQVIAQGGSDPLEASFCQRVIYGRLPSLVTDISPLWRARGHKQGDMANVFVRARRPAVGMRL